MGRSNDVADWLEHLYREEHGIPEDQELDPEAYITGPSTVGQWFGYLASELDDEINSRADGTYDWDVFVSYASERRSEFVASLVGELKELGLAVWFDQDQIDDQIDTAPDRAINPAIPRVRVGVVVVSAEYLLKEWTTYELRGLLAAGIRSLVVIAYQLGKDAEAAIARWADSVSGLEVELIVVVLRSSKVLGAAKRIRAAVRRAGRRPHLEVSERADRQVAGDLIDAFKRTLPRKLTASDIVHETAARVYGRSYDDDDIEALLEKLPQEFRDEMHTVPEEDEWGRWA